MYNLLFVKLIKMNFKAVSPLTEHDKHELNRLIKEDSSARVRMRAEAILLSGKGYPIKQISQIKGKCCWCRSKIDKSYRLKIDQGISGAGYYTALD